MSAELKQLGKDTRDLAKKFKDAGQDDLAAQLGKYAQGFNAKSEIAKSRGLETFSTTPALPEGAIRLPDLTIGGKTPKQLESALASGGFKISDWARDMLRSSDFTTLPGQQTIRLVRASALDLGMTGNPTLSQILERANTFNLGECLAEVAAYLRMADNNQPLNESYYLAMKPITDSFGRPFVFRLGRGGGGSWLSGGWAFPDVQWGPVRGFVFSLRK